MNQELFVIPKRSSFDWNLDSAYVEIGEFYGMARRDIIVSFRIKKTGFSASVKFKNSFECKYFGFNLLTPFRFDKDHTILQSSRSDQDNLPKVKISGNFSGIKNDQLIDTPAYGDVERLYIFREIDAASNTNELNLEFDVTRATF